MKWAKLFSDNIADEEWINLDMCQTIGFLKSNEDDPNWKQNGKLYKMYVDTEKTADKSTDENDVTFLVTEQEKKRIEKILQKSGGDV